MSAKLKPVAAGLALALWVGGAAAGGPFEDCFNDVDPMLTTEVLPESLRVTEADLAWMLRELERRTPAEPATDPGVPVHAGPDRAAPRPGALVADGDPGPLRPTE